MKSRDPSAAALLAQVAKETYYIVKETYYIAKEVYYIAKETYYIAAALLAQVGDVERGRVWKRQRER